MSFHKQIYLILDMFSQLSVYFSQFYPIGVKYFLIESLHHDDSNGHHTIYILLFYYQRTRC